MLRPHFGPLGGQEWCPLGPGRGAFRFAADQGGGRGAETQRGEAEVDRVQPTRPYGHTGASARLKSALDALNEQHKGSSQAFKARMKKGSHAKVTPLRVSEGFVPR